MKLLMLLFYVLPIKTTDLFTGGNHILFKKYREHKLWDFFGFNFPNPMVSLVNKHPYSHQRHAKALHNNLQAQQVVDRSA